MNTTPTTHQHRRYRALIAELGIDDDTRRQMTLQFTNGRTDSSAQLTEREMQQLITTLHQQASQQVDPAIKRRRLKAYALCRRIPFLSKGGGQVNTMALDHFCQLRTKAHCRLYDMTESQLNALLTQLEIIASKEDEAVLDEVLTQKLRTDD